MPGELPQRPSLLSRRGLADLLPRIASAIVLMAAAVASVWIGGRVFDYFWLAASLAVGLEWQHMIQSARAAPRYVLLAAGLGLGAFFAATSAYLAALAAVALCGLALAAAADRQRRAWAAGGLVYAFALIASLSALHRSAEYGTRSIVWLFAIVWGTDMFAYLGGRLIGGAKLWPQVSPSKTWSGTLTGIFAGAAFGTVTGLWGQGVRAHVVAMFALSIAAAAFSQAGDFFESAIKRRFGTKDSSHLIPGHGGFMDRLDGFIAAAVFAALFGVVRGRGSIAAGLFDWS